MTEENFNTDEHIEEAVAPPQVDNAEHQTEQQPEETVPLSALQSERKQRQQREEELQLMRDHLALMQTRKEEPKERSSDLFEQLPDDDIPTWGDVKKVFSEREKKYQARLGELQMMQKHPDYSEVIQKHLPQVLKNDPELADSLRKSQDYNLAYYLAKNSDSYRADHSKAKRSKEAERILENSQRAGSLSSTGTTSPINVAKHYKEMPDSEFKKLVNKNLGYMN